MPEGSYSPESAEAAGEDTAADRVFVGLSELILTGAIAPGIKISEPELASRFGVSRAPLREALRRLQERKLVTRIAHQGARVTVLSPPAIAELYLVREALEGVAARQAALAMSDAAIDELRLVLEEHEARVTERDVYLQGAADDDFHFRIIRASGNDMLITLLLDEYYLLIRLLRCQLPQRGGSARRSLTEHRRILDAIADRDGALAEILMRRHVAAAYARLVCGMPKKERPGGFALPAFLEGDRP
jgi:DNA-binding GntR family transcriptional regulator